MDYKLTSFLIFCLILPHLSYQHTRSRVNKNNSKFSGAPFYKEPSNWKTIVIIVCSVLFFGAVIYGTTCFQICKMHFFERTEKKYTKMDSCTHVWQYNKVTNYDMFSCDKYLGFIFLAYLFETALYTLRYKKITSVFYKNKRQQYYK